MVVRDLGLMAYRAAWAVQEEVHTRVVGGGEETLFLVEHPPVVTFGRRPGVEKNLVASREALQRMGVEVVQSDRGGDITFHGPGQLVAYPIVRLADHGLSVSGYVRRLEEILIAALREMGIEAFKDPQAIGVWTRANSVPAKIAALGVRIRKGVSLHGIALNVSTDLSCFDFINPCGLSRPVTSMKAMGSALGMEKVRPLLATAIVTAFTANIPPSRILGISDSA